MAVLLLLVGLAILVKGADFFVDGASGLAKKMGISPLIIGLTVVAFGTSAPELFINVQSALHQHTDLAIGNIIGSNISNILLICGLAAALAGLQMDKVIHQNFAISIWLGLLFGVVSLNPHNAIGMRGGIVLLGAMIIYMIYMFMTSKKQDIQMPERVKQPIRMLLVMVIGGLVGLIFGSNLVVEHAVVIAQKIGLSERVIGLTIIAIGTSLPELLTTIVSVRKGQSELGVGNIVGSNIFNIGMIGGITALIHPMVFTTQAYIDLFVYLAATVLVLILLFTGKRYRITKSQGLIFIGLYIAYLVYSIFVS